METPSDNDENDLFQLDAVREYVAAHGYTLMSARERWVDATIRLVIFFVGIFLIYKGGTALAPAPKTKINKT